MILKKSIINKAVYEINISREEILDFVYFKQGIKVPDSANIIHNISAGNIEDEDRYFHPEKFGPKDEIQILFEVNNG